MITFQITYDENIPKAIMGINNHPLRGDSMLNDYINTPLERWIDFLLYRLPIETNDRDIHILFTGSDEGYELMRRHVQENLATRRDAQFTLMRKSEYFSYHKENESISNKEIYLQEKKEMEALSKGLEELSFDILWMRKERIKKIEAPNFTKEPYMHLLENAIYKKEHEDLDAMCDEIGSYTMEQCDKLKQDISETKYSKTGIECVVAQIEKRKRTILELEQSQELERMFFGVETFDKDKLNELEAYLRSGKYFSRLVEPYAIIIENRKEILSRTEIELLCENYLDMSYEELRDLRQKLLSGEFQEIYVLSYVKAIDVQMDTLEIMDIESICQKVDEDNRESVDEAIEELTLLGYKERLWKPYEVALRIQKVYMEKMFLVKKCNDFNQLTQSEAVHLLGWIKEQNISESIKHTYSQCLLRRIHNIQSIAMYPYSSYLESLLKNTQVGNLFCMAMISSDYQQKVEGLRKKVIEVGNYSMPIAVMEGSKTGGTIIFKDCLIFYDLDEMQIIPLSDVRNIEVNKKMLQAQVILSTNSGHSYPLLTIMGHKKGEDVAKVLLNLVNTIRTKVPLPEVTAKEISMPLWSRSIGSPEKIQHVITSEKVIQRFMFELNQVDEIRMKFIFSYNSPDWYRKLEKAKEQFLKVSDNEIPLVLWDASKGNLRYGMCITDRRIYIKTAEGKDYDVSLGQVYEIIPSVTELGVSFLLKLTNAKVFELPFEPMEEELAMKWKMALEDLFMGILECQNKVIIECMLAQRPIESFNNMDTGSTISSKVEVPVPDAIIYEREVPAPKAEPIMKAEPVFVPKPEPIIVDKNEVKPPIPERVEMEFAQEAKNNADIESEYVEILEEAEYVQAKPQKAEVQYAEEQSDSAKAQYVEEQPDKAEVQYAEKQPGKVEVQYAEEQPDRVEAQYEEQSDRAEAQYVDGQPDKVEVQYAEEQQNRTEAEYVEAQPEKTEEVEYIKVTLEEIEVLEDDDIEDEVYIEDSEDNFLDIDALIDRIINE